MVAVLAPNSPLMLEAHFGVPMAGAILNALNIRLDAASIAFILDHSEARILLVDREYGQLARDAVELMEHPITVIDAIDPAAEGPLTQVGETEYEAFLASGASADELRLPQDEWDSISINYTSGTTATPRVCSTVTGACFWSP